MHRFQLFLFSLLFIFGGVGSIIFGLFPILGSVLIVLGTLGAVWTYVASEVRGREVDAQLEAANILLAREGVGNLYMEAVSRELKRTGRCRNAVFRLEKALELNPNDMDALVMLSACLPLQLAADQWLSRGAQTAATGCLFRARSIAERGLQGNPDAHVFYDALGILADLQGNHEEARTWFERSGQRRTDPYWRLYVATSWGMSGEHLRGLEQIEAAIREGARGWLVDFYHGRALVHCGRYEDGLRALQAAYQARGMKPQLLESLQEAYYLLGYTWQSSKYEFLLALQVLFLRQRACVHHSLMALYHAGVAFVCRVSKSLWPRVQRSPAAARWCYTIWPPDLPESVLGEMLADRGHYEAALRHFEAAHSICPTVPRHLCNIGLCHARLGRTEEAVSCCQRALDLQPGNQQIERLLTTVRNGLPRR